MHNEYIEALDVVLDFVENENKFDRNREVAEAAATLEHYRIQMRAAPSFADAEPIIK